MATDKKFYVGIDSEMFATDTECVYSIPAIEMSKDASHREHLDAILTAFNCTGIKREHLSLYRHTMISDNRNDVLVYHTSNFTRNTKCMKNISRVTLHSPITFKNSYEPIGKHALYMIIICTLAFMIIYDIW